MTKHEIVLPPKHGGGVGGGRKVKNLGNSWSKSIVVEKRCSNMLILGMESKISLFGPPVARLWQYISMYFAIYQQKLVYSGLPQARSKTKIFS